MLTRLTFALFLILGLSLSIAAQEKNELVGTYVFSFAWGGTGIELKANGTFISHTSNCTQVFTSSGPYSVTNNVLSLTRKKYSVRSFSDNKEHDLTKRKARKEYLDTDEPFKPETWHLQIVSWGPRIYLMDEKSFESFIDAINLGFEPRQAAGYRDFYGYFLVREGDLNKAIYGQPQVPKQFLDRLLSAPVTATITRLEPEDKWLIATIDRGSEHGLRKGMALITVEEANSSLPQYQPNWIISVEPTTAKVRMVVDASLETKLTTRITNVDRYQ